MQKICIELQFQYICIENQYTQQDRGDIIFTRLGQRISCFNKLYTARLLQLCYRCAMLFSQSTLATSKCYIISSFFLSFFLSLQSALIMSPYNTFAFQWVQLVRISTSNSPGYNSFRYLLYFLYSFAFKFPYQSAANYFTFA